MRKKVITVGTLVLFAICAVLVARRSVAGGLDSLADSFKVGVLRDVAVALAPDDPNVYLERAKHNSGSAMNDYNTALALDNRNAEAYRQRADLQADPQGAARDLTKAIELERRPEDYLKRGQYYLFARRYEQAAADLDLGAKQSPSEVLAGVAQEISGRARTLRENDVALAEPLEKAAEKLRRTIMERGKAFMAQGKDIKAVREFSMAARLRQGTDPGQNAYVMRSLAYSRIGDDIGAEADLAKANEQCGPERLESWLVENHWR
jgi:tetratricopeptide (TPR) repeat protein